MLELFIQKVKKWNINLFDVLVLTAIILVIGVFLWLRASKKTEWINVRLVVANDEWWWEGQPPQWWYVDDLKVGQTAYNSFGEKVAEIYNIESFDTGGYKRRAFIDLRLKGAYEKKRQIYTYNFQPLQIGKPLDLTFGKHNVRGLITYIDKIEIDYKQKKIQVRLAQVNTWIAESIRNGIEMKDSQGRVLAVVESVEVRPYTYYEFSDIRGQMIKVTNPDFREVLVTLTINTFESGGYTYFVDRAAIKIGEKIWFQFPQAVIREAEITKIFE